MYIDDHSMSMIGFVDWLNSKLGEEGLPLVFSFLG